MMTNQRPADLDGFLNSDEFAYKSSGRGLKMGDHRAVEAATGLDFQQALNDLQAGVAAAVVLYRAIQEGKPATEVPPPPVIQNESGKKAALIWVIMRRQHPWLTLDDLDELEVSRSNTLTQEIIVDLATLNQQSDIPETVPDDTPLEEPPTATDTGKNIDDEWKEGVPV